MHPLARVQNESFMRGGAQICLRRLGGTGVCSRWYCQTRKTATRITPMTKLAMMSTSGVFVTDTPQQNRISYKAFSTCPKQVHLVRGQRRSRPILWSPGQHRPNQYVGPRHYRVRPVGSKPILLAKPMRKGQQQARTWSSSVGCTCISAINRCDVGKTYSES